MHHVLLLRLDSECVNDISEFEKMNFFGDFINEFVSAGVNHGLSQKEGRLYYELTTLQI